MSGSSYRGNRNQERQSKKHSSRVPCLFKQRPDFLEMLVVSEKSSLRGISNKAATNKTACPSQNEKLSEKIVGTLPKELQPYLKLMRADKPVGTWLLFWPCGWSLALATPGGTLPDLWLLSLFLSGAFVMRGAGCTVNDMWDRDFDKKVERTKDRPLASGQVPFFNALVFLAGQLGLGLSILLQFNWDTILIGASSLGLVALYPAMKRITNWPQFVLGLTFNWGALIGWSALHGSTDWSAIIPLYTAGVCWTLVYDTVYAHQDKEDDAIIGVKSTALHFGDDTKKWLSAFSVGMVANLLVAGTQSGQTWPYYAAVGLTGAHLARQIYTVNLNDPSDCGAKFVSNKYIGLLLFLGISAGSYFKKELTTKENSTELAVPGDSASAARESSRVFPDPPSNYTPQNTTRVRKSV